jgi:hypothetical protein
MSLDSGIVGRYAVRKVHFARLIVAVILLVAIGAYSVDCNAMTTPEQAMQCCKSMHCMSSHHNSSGNHSTDCCKTMPDMRAALGQPSSVHSISLSPAALAVLPVSKLSQDLQAHCSLIAIDSHSPPVPFSPPPLSLRI